MKTLKALVACLFAGLVVMGFVGCSDAGSKSTVYAGMGGGEVSVTLTAYDDGSWVMAESVSGTTMDVMKGTYKGSIDSDGEIELTVTHMVGESGKMEPVSSLPPMPVIMSENGNKMSFGFSGDTLVLTRK